MADPPRAHLDALRERLQTERAVTFKNGSRVTLNSDGSMTVRRKSRVTYSAGKNLARAYNLALNGKETLPPGPREPFYPRLAREQREREAKRETKAERRARLLGEVQPSNSPSNTQSNKPDEDRWGDCPF